METRTLDSPPGILPLYAKAAVPMIPGASLLPFLPGGGGEVPEIELRLDGVRAERDAVAAYDRVCGFTLRDELPPTYPHMLAFPLHMAVMSDRSFPFGAVGLVHVENRIEQHRPIGIGEEIALAVRPTPLRPHPKGRTFSLITEARVGEELAWESESTMLRRGGGEDAPKRDGAGGEAAPELRPTAEWRLPGDLGRRYGAVSGDRNPIHMHSLTAKPLGFKAAIAHGMWTKARCLAALQNRLPGAFGVEVRFRKPIFLPGRVEFLSAGEDVIDFAVRDAKRGTAHLDGRLWPLEGKPRSGRTN
jgi:acyl dehydratase